MKTARFTEKTRLFPDKLTLIFILKEQIVFIVRWGRVERGTAGLKSYICNERVAKKKKKNH